MDKQLVYAVDDEENILSLIKYNLEKNGYEVKTFTNAESMLAELKVNLPCIFVLDIMLPGIDGIETCRLIRKNEETEDIPIIMLSAKSEEFDKVLGLEIGADDYLTKPFSVRELSARVKALLRRSSKSSNKTEEKQQNILTCDNLKLDKKKREVYKGDEKIELSMKEFELLKYLMENRGNVITRDILLDKIWGFDYFGETRTVDVHIRYLRQKIEDDDKNPIFIETVRSVGYKFKS